ncbi:MAG: DUF2058 domain-containing protein [Steroidobacteraceae bacterium]
MSLSLREQLLQAGLVSSKQVKQAEHKKRPQGKFDPNAKTAQQLAVQKAQAEKAARDQELNRQRQEKAERKARMTQIWQLVDQNRIPRVDSEEHFNFVHMNRVHRIAVDAALRERLTKGEVVIVRYGKFYAPVLPAIAERVRERDASAIVDLNALQTSSAEPAADDPYKDFAVPDDLMW